MHNYVAIVSGLHAGCTYKLLCSDILGSIQLTNQSHCIKTVFVDCVEDIDIYSSFACSFAIVHLKWLETSQKGLKSKPDTKFCLN